MKLNFLKTAFKTNVSKALVIPDGFVKMTTYQKQALFIIPDQQPNEAYIFGKSVTLAIRLTTMEFSKEKLEEFKVQAFDQVYENTTEKYQSELFLDLNQIRFSYETKTENSQFVNTCVGPYKKKLLLVNFTCFINARDYWEKRFNNTFNSVRSY